MQETEVAEDEGVERQMFSYTVQTENRLSGTKVVTLVDSLHVASPPSPLTAFNYGLFGTFCMEIRTLFCVIGLM